MREKSRIYRLAVWAAIAVAIVSSGSSDGLSPEVLEKIKAATVFIKTNDSAEEVQGSGFIVRRNGKMGYVLTNAHVVNASDRFISYVTAVLGSGSGHELELSRAEVLASDPKEDVAVVLVFSSNLPDPIAIPENPEIYETMPVYIFGFPFGEGLSFDQSHPAPTVSRGAVSSIRKSNGRVLTIQIDGDINPGNSGGPVVDENGFLVGMSTAKITSTQIGFTIPAQRLAKLMTGYVQDADLTDFQREGSKYHFEASASLFDPLRKLDSVELLIAPEAGSGASLTADSSQEQRAEAAPDMKSYNLEIRQIVALGDGEIDRGDLAGDTVGFVFMVKSRSKTGEILYTAPKRFELDFREKKAGARKPDQEANPGSADHDEGEEEEQTVDLEVMTAPPAALKISPPALESELTYLRLPSLVYDVDKGGGGRYLVLFLKDIRKLAIFDLNSAAITKYISLPTDEILFAAGATKLVVILKEENIIQRYDLMTGERELNAKLPFHHEVVLISMGSEVENPAFIARADVGDGMGRRDFCPLEINSLQTGTCIKDEIRLFNDPHSQLRASPKGNTYCWWEPASSTSGLASFVKQDPGYRLYHESKINVAYAAPSPEGNLLLTNRGIYTNQLYPLMAGSGSAYSFIPANLGNLSLGLRMNATRGPQAVKSIEIFVTGNAQPLLSIPSRDFMFGVEPFNKHPDFGLDKHYFFYPYSGLIIFISQANDQLVLMKFDLDQALEESGLDYLYVSSIAPLTADRGKDYSYRVEVRSKQGKVSYELKAAPDGMKISRDGLITWKVPAQWEAPPPAVQVEVSDRSGQKTSQTFQLNIE